MPYKDPAVRKEKGRGYSAKYYKNNRQASKERNAANKVRYRQQWREFKSGFACVACGLSGYPDVLDFHHLPQHRASGDKMSVNRLIAHCRYTRARQETEKCVALCANCHRLGHQYERSGWPEVLDAFLLTLRPYFLSARQYMVLVSSGTDKGSG